MLNGQKELTDTHIALFNYNAVNNFVQKLRAGQFPWGTDFQGIQYLMRHQLSDPYIRQTRYYEDGHFVVLCQFPEQSRLLLESYEIQADKTFSRTACHEFEINSYSNRHEERSLLPESSQIMKIKLDIVRLSDYASRLQKAIQKSEFPRAI